MVQIIVELKILLEVLCPILAVIFNRLLGLGALPFYKDFTKGSFSIF